FLPSISPSPPTPPLFPYTTLFRSHQRAPRSPHAQARRQSPCLPPPVRRRQTRLAQRFQGPARPAFFLSQSQYHRLNHRSVRVSRSEEHTSELRHLVISYAVFCLKK